MNHKAISTNLQVNEKTIFNFVIKNVRKYGFDEYTNQDIVQDIMIKLYTKTVTFNGNSKVTTWLYSIIRNHCLNVIRSKNRTYKLILAFNDWDSFPGKEKDTESLHTFDEIKKMVNMYVCKLPEYLQMPIRYYYYENYKYQDISQKMNIPIGTVKSRIYIAKTKLKKWLLAKRENAELIF